MKSVSALLSTVNAVLTCRLTKSDSQRRVGGDERLPFETITARRLAAAFILYGLVAIAFLVINMPPFQNPDELQHFTRAAQVAEGGLVGTRFSTTFEFRSQHEWAGGPVDPAVPWAFGPFDALRFHPETKASRAMWEPRIHWTRMREPQIFSNTAVNPPFFYMPSAIGVLLGRATRMTVTQTLVLSRLLTGMVAVTVAAGAIACAGGAAVWMFAILTLPMSLSLIASSSQDALMLSCSALAAVMLVRLFRWPSDHDRKELALLVVSLVLVGTARPPYGALALLPLGLTKLPLRWRMLASAAVVVGVLAWSAIAAATALSNIGGVFGADPTAQMARIRADPLLVVRATWNSLVWFWPDYLEEFVGRLSHFDLVLSPAYHTAAQVMLMVAAVGAMLGLRGELIGVGSRLTIAAGLFLSTIGIFVIEYLTWTVPGTAAVNGVEGRYFLPLALAGTALLPALGNTRLARLRKPLVLMVAAFPVVTLGVVMRAVVLRYYLQ